MTIEQATGLLVCVLLLNTAVTLIIAHELMHIRQALEKRS